MGLVAGEWILGVDQMQNAGEGSSPYPVTIDATLTPPGWVLPIAQAAADQHHVPVALLLALAAQESGFQTWVTSSAGAQGMMQLMPKTASSNGVTDPFDATQSMQGGASYVATLYAEFNGNLPLIVAAYNAGGQAVIDYGNKIPPYKETEAYVPDVLARYHYYSSAIADGTIESHKYLAKTGEQSSTVKIQDRSEVNVLVRLEGLAAGHTLLAFKP
jgi:soluble lytic murein transglycosylase-like protein